MRKKVRLRLHVEADLLGTRITPSPRKRDPRRAKIPKAEAAWMTVAQQALWRALFNHADYKGDLKEGTPLPIERIADLCQAVTKSRLLWYGFYDLRAEVSGDMIEIIAKLSQDAHTY